ncbi:MAG: hypothetical protein EBV06_03730 [Planctomycetia bacterium]|nr:hypothetical protein [Planctomycetia bacterium]
MHKSPFGLRCRPFPPLPDHPYASSSFEHALAALTDALADGETYVSLTGVPGVGKSLAGRLLVERLGGDSVYVNTAITSPTALLQAILFDLRLPHEGRSPAEMHLAIVDRFLKQYSAGHKTTLVIDEAHLFSSATLEELRLLGNLEGTVQVVLIGQPSLINNLDAPELASLRQRIAIRAVLEPMDIEESCDYVLHHLRIAGAAEGLIDSESLQMLAKATGGVPRLLNQAMNRAIRMAVVTEADVIEAEVMLEALIGLGLSVPEESDERRPMSSETCRIFAPANRA